MPQHVFHGGGNPLATRPGGARITSASSTCQTWESPFEPQVEVGRAVLETASPVSWADASTLCFGEVDCDRAARLVFPANRIPQVLVAMERAAIFRRGIERAEREFASARGEPRRSARGPRQRGPGTDSFGAIFTSLEHRGAAAVPALTAAPTRKDYRAPRATQHDRPAARACLAAASVRRAGIRRPPREP